MERGMKGEGIGVKERDMKVEGRCNGKRYERGRDRCKGKRYEWLLNGEGIKYKSMKGEGVCLHLTKVTMD